MITGARVEFTIGFYFIQFFFSHLFKNNNVFSVLIFKLYKIKGIHVQRTYKVDTFIFNIKKKKTLWIN